MENLDKNDSAQIWAVFGAREHFGSQKMFWSKSFFGIQESTFFAVKNIQNNWAIKLIFFVPSMQSFM